MERTKVLIVDDSALVRQLLTELISHDPALEVVGAASDPYAAWEKIKSLRPEVLTLDVEMPRMDGLAFLERLMRARPMPVLMVSSLTEKGCENTLRALELGAVDFVTKPKIDIKNGTIGLADEIIAKIKIAARARVRPAQKLGARDEARLSALRTEALARSTQKVVAIGASTGGTEALREVLTALPADSPGIVIVQHMPEHFTRAFAQRLDGLSQIRVQEARDGDRILPGHALIAPGNYHMRVVRSGANYNVEVFMAEPVNRHRPSVDVLFYSCARHLGRNAIGVLMTGMGGDGARGLLAMRQVGARTLAQDEATSVVFGMPKEAIELGAVGEVLALNRIAEAVVSPGADR
ncbi:MAG TPA: chemotaxis response regulator protein-glutamate methylesterase [Verrucomicrobiae bacterium]|jgi:two-component system chemotaxis response regulator CheB|nr:chemotaxis response regulator protein-glutamate methylesterase [Verrucomicrobiae bacterium]